MLFENLIHWNYRRHRRRMSSIPGDKDLYGPPRDFYAFPVENPMSRPYARGEM